MELDFKHIIRLIVKGSKKDGWTPVSETVLPLVKALPPSLVEFNEDNSCVKLTGEGIIVATFM